jgi:hypothetical protein
MKVRHILSISGSLAIAAGQSPSKAIITNLDTAKWVHERGIPSRSCCAATQAPTAWTVSETCSRPCDPAALARV